MSKYKITLQGLEAMLQPEDSLFSDISLPSGIDKETLVYSILTRANEFELLYSDPEYLKPAISLWSKKMYRTFDKWIKALDIKYDPLNNFDRYEEYTDEHEGTMKEDRTGSGSNSSTTSASGSSSDDTTSEGQTSAYNANTYQPADKTITGTDVETESSSEGSSEYSDKSNADRSDKAKDKHVGHLYGNIGVTTSQQMLQSELDIARWNIYVQISDLFVSEFCLMVY